MPVRDPESASAGCVCSGSETDSSEAGCCSGIAVGGADVSPGGIQHLLLNDLAWSRLSCFEFGLDLLTPQAAEGNQIKRDGENE